LRVRIGNGTEEDTIQGEAIMRRVVITGMGIVSSIGNNTQEVLSSLHEARSGITRAEKYAEMGFRSQVQGAPTLDPTGVIDRRAMRFLAEGAAWNHVAMEQAIQDAGLDPSDVSNDRTGIIMGSGGPSARTIVEAADITRSKGPKRVRNARHLVQDQGRELFDFVGLRDFKSLYRQRLRDHSTRQAGPGFCRWLRGTRLEPFGPVRCDGRDVVETQRHARDGLAAL
jgi:hypothetical protein